MMLKSLSQNFPASRRHWTLLEIRIKQFTFWGDLAKAADYGLLKQI